MSGQLLFSLGIVLGCMLLLWIIGTIRRDVSVVDPFWGTGFVIIAWTAVLTNQPASPRGWLLAILTTIWGLRLSGYLLWRNWGHAEDRRYAAMRTHHGQRFWWISLITVFLVQGLLLWLISFPQQIVAVEQTPHAFGWIDVCGMLLWGTGFVFETVGDWQLAHFKANPANRSRVMDQGLWRYTRHPNYFGDFCIWWAFYLFACADGASWTIFSPALMSLFLMRISGVSLLESDITDRRPDYAIYKRCTNAFFPGLPKK